MGGAGADDDAEMIEIVGVAATVFGGLFWAAYNHTETVDRYLWRVSAWCYVVAAGLALWNVRVWVVADDVRALVQKADIPAADKIIDAAMIPGWTLGGIASFPGAIIAALAIAKALKRGPTHQ